jgi:hypothetical protein
MFKFLFKNSYDIYKILLFHNIVQFIVYSIYFKNLVIISNLLTPIYFNILLNSVIPLFVLNFYKQRYGPIFFFELILYSSNISLGLIYISKTEQE